MKMTKYQAEQLIAAWRANALWGSVADVFEIDEQRGFFPYGIGVRVLLGDSNKIANNALWDSKWITAQNALMKYGIEQGKSFKKKDGMNRGHVNKKDHFRAADFRNLEKK